MTDKRILKGILLVYLVLGSIYAITTPVFEASDELWHYPMVHQLANGGPLPVQVFDPNAAGPWRQEASQPPLYYYLAAAVTFWIDTSDLEEVRWLNPHVDNGVITADGNVNLVVHDPALSPWRGTLLAVRVVRLFSVALGAVTVYLTYRIASEVIPERREIAYGAAAVNAFTPMFLFISGAVNNDNLVIPLASLSLVLMIRLVQQNVVTDETEIAGNPLAHSTTWRARAGTWLLLGIVIGLGALTKITAVGLIPLAVLTAVSACWRESLSLERRQRLVIWTKLLPARLLLIVLPVALIAGWWYVRNLQLYGDWTGWNAFIAVLGQRSHPASFAQLWDERWGFMLSYWGLFGGVNVPMWNWTYHVLNGFLIASIAGFLMFGLKEMIGLPDELGRRGTRTQQFLRMIVERCFPLLLCLLWSAAVVVGLIRWATVTWSSQGRLVFSAISALSTLIAVGLAGWHSGQVGRWLLTAFSLLLLFLSIVVPLVWIRPAYHPITDVKVSTLTEADIVFGERMKLVGYRLESNRVQPGDSVDVTLAWEVLRSMTRDWSVFVHLNDPVLDAPVAQRDMYPGGGLRATSLLEPGEGLIDTYRLELPDTLFAPAELQLAVGLYDVSSGERLKTGIDSDSALLAEIALSEAPGSLPNPVTVNFANKLELVGYNFKPRRVLAGESLELTLYWQTYRSVDRDYTIFAQVLDDDTTRWASYDLVQPTRQWQPEQEMPVKLPLRLDADTPPGVYPIIVGVYTRTEGGQFDRLQTVTTEGRLTDDFVMLTNVRVD